MNNCHIISKEIPTNLNVCILIYSPYNLLLLYFKYLNLHIVFTSWKSICQCVFYDSRKFVIIPNNNKFLLLKKDKDVTMSCEYGCGIHLFLRIYLIFNIWHINAFYVWCVWSITSKNYVYIQHVRQYMWVCVCVYVFPFQE